MIWRTKFSQLLLLSSCLCYLDPVSLVSAQITPDKSLGKESSIVTPKARVKHAVADLIAGGAIRGNNLFHSFSKFNVSNGGRVYFANPDGIANILTRVTGTNRSKILGKLGVDGAANLFLLNPNGIIFGKNASLDVNGSFLATTADRLIFNNGFEYSATNPNIPPLLTVNLPVGLQFGSQATTLVNNSINSNNFEETVGLEVKPAQNLTFVGGDILLEGGTINAPNSSIEIGSVVPNSLVKILPKKNNWTLDYTGVDSFQDISLTKGAGISSSSDNGAGKINIQANKLSVLEGSFISADNFGEIDGGRLTINAAESVEVNGRNRDGFSSITSEVYDTGKGANLTIKTKTLQVIGGAYISADNYGIGDGGNLTIYADELIKLAGKNKNYSSISTDINNSGNGGNIRVETDNLQVKDNAFISSDVLIDGDILKMGNGGNVKIEAADLIEVVGIDSDGFNNSISTDVILFTDASLAELNLEPNSANAGNLTIETGTLRVANGGYVATDNFGSGKAGNLTINASDLVEVVGNSAEGIQSYISTSVYGTADGGNFTINTGTLRIVDDAYVEAITYAVGNGGALKVNANQIIVKGGGKLGVGASNYVNFLESRGNAGNLIVNASDYLEISGNTPLREKDDGGEVFFTNVNSSLFATTNSDFSGNGGKIIIETSHLKLFDGGTIDTNTSSAGNGGNIVIRANTIEVADRIKDSFGSPSGINSLVDLESTGNGGNIDIFANNLRVVAGGLISVDALGNGNAGNIKINAQNMDIAGVSAGEIVFDVEQEQLPSQISAFSGGGFDAGSINIKTDTLNLRDRGTISVSNFGNGNSGNLNITASQLNLDNAATLEAQVNAGNRGNLNLTTDNLFLKNNSQITAKASGKATGGNISINNSENIVLLENSQIIADAIAGMGGKINITTQGLFVFPDSKISASSQFGLDGNVDIETINSDRHLEANKLPENPIDATKKITKGCSAATNFAMVGRGGVPENPLQTNLSNNIWTDLRPLANPTITNLKISSHSLKENQTQKEIIEAQAWKVNDRGQIELFSPINTYNLPENPISCS